MKHINELDKSIESLNNENTNVVEGLNTVNNLDNICEDLSLNLDEFHILNKKVPNLTCP
ncbi:hypothetical protein [Clostridium peptidivorans]|uniref:hypothetical protein n=1 Tax=Clostridium peptidivorans TaxID=100174 RepID=UPI0015C6B172|nr:hypothetical protein [Clostridium peptidivorans]